MLKTYQISCESGRWAWSHLLSVVQLTNEHYVVLQVIK